MSVFWWKQSKLFFLLNKKMRVRPVVDFIGGFFSYFTIWTLVGVGYILSYNPSSLFLKGVVKTMVVQSSIGGFYITYIYPRNIYVPYCNIHLRGPWMKILDFFSHHLPVFWIHLDRNNFSSTKDKIFLQQKLFWLVPVLIYISLFSVSIKYHLRNQDIFILTGLFLTTLSLH